MMEHIASYVKGVQCLDKRQQMYEVSKCNSRCEVERSSKSWDSIARAKGKGAKEDSDRSKIKKEK